jgi:hypothetical protein
MGELVPSEPRNLYSIAEQGAAAQISKIKDELSEQCDDISEEQSIVRYMMRVAATEGDVSRSAGLAELSMKLSSAARNGATARSDYVARKLVLRFMREIVDTICDEFRPLFPDDEAFSAKIDEILRTLDQKFEIVRNNLGEPTMIHGRHVSEFKG